MSCTRQTAVNPESPAFSSICAPFSAGARLAEGTRAASAVEVQKENSMVRWKRFTSGFLSSIDGFIAQVENHEALATSALRELEQGVGRSKVQLVRVGRDGVALRQALV